MTMKEGFIQKEDPRSPELPTPTEFREFRRALTVIYEDKPQSPAFKFNQPSSFSRKAFEMLSQGKGVPSLAAKFYYPDVPNPFDLEELSDPVLTNLIQTFGPDLTRAKMVSKKVMENNHSMLPAGGACLIETWGLDLLNKSVICQDTDTKADVTQRIINDAPYYTQITGTMLMGGKANLGLMYREEFPWYLLAE